jgi:nucleotide-binding universal stress UspA family protein
MQRFKNILFVADAAIDSDESFSRAIRLARANKAKITAVSVQRELDRNLPNLQTAIIRHQRERLKSLTSRIDTKGVTVKTEVLLGIPFVEIIKNVISGNYDLVMKSAEGRGGLGRLLFGSTDWHLMRKCPCPVWIVKASKRKRVSRVLAAVDVNPEIGANTELNQLILDLATSLAEREGSKLHVVHAWSAPGEKSIRSGRIQMHRSDREGYVKEIRKAHKMWLSDLLDEYELGSSCATIHLLKGDPADVIPKVATESNVELVIMGTVARTGIPGFLIGNTAEKTLSRLNCSVLTVKPASFKTPIQLDSRI